MQTVYICTCIDAPCAQETSKITIENTYFTMETAKQWKGKTDLFISDIRAISCNMSDAENEVMHVSHAPCPVCDPNRTAFLPLARRWDGTTAKGIF